MTRTSWSRPSAYAFRTSSVEVAGLAGEETPFGETCAAWQGTAAERTATRPPSTELIQVIPLSFPLVAIVVVTAHRLLPLGLRVRGRRLDGRRCPRAMVEKPWRQNNRGQWGIFRRGFHGRL